MLARIYNRGNVVSKKKLTQFGSDLWVDEKTKNAWWMDPASELNEIKAPMWGFTQGWLPTAFDRFFRLKFTRSLALDASDGYALNLAHGIRKRFRGEPTDEGDRMADANDRAAFLKSTEVERNGFNWGSEQTFWVLLAIGAILDAALLILIVLPHVPGYLAGGGA